MFDPISKYLMSCYFMRYLVGSLAFYLLVVSLYQYCNGGWEDIKKTYFGVSHRAAIIFDQTDIGSWLNISWNLQE